MSRPLRYLAPSTTWFVTTRCIDARFLLRPDQDLNAALGLCLARACKRYPEITLFGFVALSNHLHILLIDPRSQLSSFMELFLGTLAKAVNLLRNRRGHVFERRFSAEPVLDPCAIKERWMYLVLNPVRAGLVSRHEQWPGLCLRSTSTALARYVFRRFRKDRYKAACRTTAKGSVRPSPKDFYEEEVVMVAPLPESARQVDKAAMQRSPLEEIRAHEGRIREERQRQRLNVMGADKVLAQRPFAAPTNPNRSERPLCHTVLAGVHKQFREMMRVLRQAYAEASARYRRGAFTTEFPRYMYRPPVPVLGTC